MHEGLLLYKEKLQSCKRASTERYSMLLETVEATGKSLTKLKVKQETIDRYFSNAHQRGSKDGMECDLTVLLEISELDFSFKEFHFDANLKASFGAQVGPATSEGFTQTQQMTGVAKCVQTDNISSIVPFTINSINSFSRNGRTLLVIRDRKSGSISPSTIIEIENYKFQIFGYRRVCERHLKWKNCP